MSQEAQDLFDKGNHIVAAKEADRSKPVTDVIKEQDQTYRVEAQKNNNVLQMLTKLRTEMNMSDMNQFPMQSNTGLLKTFQSLLGGGLSGIFGQMTQLATQVGQNQNNNNMNANNQPNTAIQAVDANGNIITIG